MAERIPIQERKEPSEREKAQIDLYRGFTSLELYFDGGGLPSSLPGWLENANVCILTKDKDGEFASKLGWGDFALEGERGTPKNLVNVGGPAFILPQFGAYMLYGKDAERWRSQPKDYLFGQARFIVDGEIVYVPKTREDTIRREVRPETLAKIQFADFDSPQFKEQFQVQEIGEYRNKMDTALVNFRIGEERFKRLMDILSGRGGQEPRYGFRRVYERWLHFITYVERGPFSPRLWKDEKPWLIEENRERFMDRVRQLIREINIYTPRDFDSRRKAEKDALRELDPQAAEEIELAEAMNIISRRLEAYSNDEILKWGSRWDPVRKEFRREDE